MATTPEGKVKKKVKAVLVEYGVYYFMPVQTGYGAPGLDFHCCAWGHALFIETKAPGQKLTPRQQTTADSVRAAGGLFLCLSGDDDILALRAILEDLRNATTR